MKRTMSRLLSILVIVVMVFSFTACNTNIDNGGGKVNPDESELKIEVVYAMAVDLGFTGTLDELIAAFKGDSAYQIAVSKGYTGTEQQWLDSLVGAAGTKGADGNDGISPQIGINGNWYIGTTDTGIKAQGDKGEDGSNGLSAYQIWLGNGNNGTEVEFLDWLKGEKGNNGTNGSNGSNGSNGTDGKSAYKIFIETYPEYQGSESQWITDFSLGKLLRTITFEAVGEVVAIKNVIYGYSYSLDDMPLFPEKIGNIGGWDITDFSNITQDMTVTAIYETQGLSFTLINGDTEYEVKKGTMNSNTQEVFIPSEYGGKPVTSIGSQAFNYTYKLTRIVIPNSVKSIGNTAFYQNGDFSSFKSVIFESGSRLETIGSYAFGHCNSLVEIAIPTGVTRNGIMGADLKNGLGVVANN